MFFDPTSRPRRHASLVGLGMLLGSVLLAASLGRLRLQSNPEVEVVWEGVSLGITSDEGVMVIDDIPLGAYSITLAKPGFASRTVSVLVTEGETTIRLDLTPEQPPESEVPLARDTRRGDSETEEARGTAPTAERPRGNARTPALPEPSIIDAPADGRSRAASPTVVDERADESGNAPRPATTREPSIDAPEEHRPTAAGTAEAGRVGGDRAPLTPNEEDAGDAPRKQESRGIFGPVLGLALAAGAAVAAAEVVRRRRSVSAADATGVSLAVERLGDRDDAASRTITAVHKPSFLRELRERESEMEKIIDTSPAAHPGEPGRDRRQEDTKS